MWKVLYIAQTATQAQRLESLLSRNGFLVKVNISGVKVYEICVPPSEAEDAYEVLCEYKFQG